MRIGLFHGYELTGSGSNEYNRYLAKALLRLGHTVDIICREPHPEKLDFVNTVITWKQDGGYEKLSLHNNHKRCVLHRIPSGPIYPVYLTDKQRPGHVKSFVRLSDDELASYIAVNEKVLGAIFSQQVPDVLLANHLVMQPLVALSPCRSFGIPLLVFPHGSAIEYTVKIDDRYRKHAEQVLRHCDQLVTGNAEVRDRIFQLFPALVETMQPKTTIVGVGVDTELFQPVRRRQRRRLLDQLARSRLLGNGMGKSPDLLKSLHHQLRDGDLSVVKDFRQSYNQNAVDTDAVEKLSKVDPEQPVLLFVGALTAGKGLQSLICALPLILQSHDGTQLLVVGSGAYREVLEAFVFALGTGDGKLVREIVRSGFDLDDSELLGPWKDVEYFLDSVEGSDFFNFTTRLANQIVFLGRMNHEQLAHVFPLADIAVFPSVVAEAYPLVLMESLSNGVLPMVSYFSGFKDGIDELQRFIPAKIVDLCRIPVAVENRIAKMADSTIKLLTHLKRHDLGETLATVARENYDWRHQAAKMADVFTKLLTHT